jgi:hypothetical protein
MTTASSPSPSAPTTEVREIIQLSNNLLVWSYINDEGKTTEETWIP